MRWRSGSARADVTTRLIEGDFPNYQQLIPSGYPNQLDGRRATRCSAAVNRVRLVGQSRDTAPIRLGMNADGLELSAIAQDVGEAHESVEAKFEGTDAHRGVQLAVPARRHRGRRHQTMSCIETIDPLKPAVMRRTESPDFLYLLMPVRIA